MGNQLSVLIQMYPPKPRWGVEEIPDLTGKVIIVTGTKTAQSIPAY